MRLSLQSIAALPLVAICAAQVTINDGELPLLELPYGTYRASEYNEAYDFYTFYNIRYAAPPLGDLRWAKPAPPDTLQGIQNPNGTERVQCPQAMPPGLEFAYDILAGLEPWSEDCLFLDVRVPAKAVRGEVEDLPVMVWFHGGGYAFGSKDFFLYDSTPIMKSGNGSLIVVNVNYRLSSFGFLAGSTVEAEGTSNAGFWDQRASLQWVQDNIGLVGGDPDTVTVMGESAGGGSIAMHLLAGGGKGDLVPLFKRAIIQSTSLQLRSNSTIADQNFATFSSFAGCANATDSLSCLRNKSTAELQAANRRMSSDNANVGGGWGLGPSIDGEAITGNQTTEFTNGNYWKNISIIAAHNSGEGTPAACAVKTLAKAYPAQTYAYRFDVWPAVHAWDLLFTFNQPLNLTAILGFDLGAIGIMIPPLNIPEWERFADSFRSYLTSFAITGDPNTLRKQDGNPQAVQMPFATLGDTYLENVVNLALDKFDVRSDPETSAADCGA